MADIILTDEQKKVVEHFGSPLRVLAGPGTGKTLCIIEKTKELMTEHKVHPNNICAITFTNAAAGELRHRLEKTGVKTDSLPYVNTLHGFAMGILRKHLKRAGLKTGFRPIYGVIQRILTRDVVEDLKHRNICLSHADVKDYMSAHLQEKSKAGTPSHLSDKPLKMKALREFSKHYHENLEFYNAVDWADVLHKTIELLDCYSDIKSEVHRRTKHLLVDEYQDLSPLEQEFVDKICGDPSGLCIVGDDDQCIYETFRFASPQGIIDFPKKYKNSKLLPITLCRRCPPVVIEHALRLIKNNKKRVHEKTLKPFYKDKKGFVITLKNKSKKSEKEWLVSKIHYLLTKNYQYKDILILFTDGKIAKDYVTALKEANIPLDVQLTVSNIFGTENFTSLSFTIQWLIDNNDNLSTRQCLDYANGIGVETIRQLRLLALSSDASLWDVIENVAKNTKAFRDIRQRRKVVEFYKYLRTLKDIKIFSDIVETFFSYVVNSKEDRGCNELLSYFKKFDGQENVVELKEIYEDFQQQIDSGELENKYKKEPTEVRVMSMHSAKGCESPIVFIPALEDDIIPGVYTNNIEEKRRLFYVSLTRAKVGVYLTWAGQRTGQEIHMYNRRMFDKKMSRFLEEIDINNETS
jgi:DNA helicase-2/ATP-dependent DNA helicase PcrA